MIEITKSTSINATFKTDDGQQVAYFSASVSKETGSNISMNISNQVLYEANKEAVRTAKVEFDKYVYAVEDESATEMNDVKAKVK